MPEVFRYTLTRSEKEWVRLEDEIESVRAYLDIEQARFGERLQSDWISMNCCATQGFPQ